MKTTHKIIIGDSRKMDKIEDKSVHLIITSPPYWNLRDYGHKDQIGYLHTYEEYIDNLNIVWKECDRVLHPGCRTCINIGDYYTRTKTYGRHKMLPIHAEIIMYYEKVLKHDFMGAIIWEKVSTFNPSGGCRVIGSYPFPRNGCFRFPYEYILIFKKLGEQPKVSSEIKEASKMTNGEWNRYFRGRWDIQGVRQNKHPATWPLGIPMRLINMFSFVEETVLDPFTGAAKTTEAAILLARNSIGYEINPDYIMYMLGSKGFKDAKSLAKDWELQILDKDKSEVLEA